MSAMWQIVCVGPGPLDRPRRNVDRGPLFTDEKRVNDFAAWLRSTGFYEQVLVVRNGGIKSLGGPESEG